MGLCYHNFRARIENGIERRRQVLRIPGSRLEVRRNFFTVRAASEWNDIPDKVKEAESIASFKRKLDKHLETLW